MQKSQEKTKDKDTWDFAVRMLEIGLHKIKQANDDAEFFDAYDEKGHCLLKGGTLEQLEKRRNRAHTIKNVSKQEAIKAAEDILKFSREKASAYQQNYATKN